MLVSDFSPVWSTHHVFSNNNSYLCEMSSHNEMNLWVSLPEEPLARPSFSSFYQLGVKFCENVKSQMFLLSVKKWEHANTNISARNQNAVSNKWKASWELFWKVSYRFILKPWGGFSVWWPVLSLIQNICSQVFNSWEQVKRGFARIIFSSFFIDFFFFFSVNSQDIFFNVWKVKNIVRRFLFYCYVKP